MPVHIFDGVRLPRTGSQHVDGTVVLLSTLLVMNAIAIYIRHRFETQP